MVPALKCSDWLIRLASAWFYGCINDWVALVVCGVVWCDARAYVFPLGSCFRLWVKKKGESRIRRNWDALLHRNPKEERGFDAPTPIQSQLLTEIRRLKESPNGGLQIPQLNFLENSKKRFYPSWIRLTGRTILMLPKKNFRKTFKRSISQVKIGIITCSEVL